MWVVYWKEMRELLRDKKTVIFTVLIPIVAIPALFLGFSYLAAVLSERAVNAELKYAVVGVAPGSEFDQQLLRQPGLRRVAVAGIDEVTPAIRDERIDFALAVPPDFAQGLADGKQRAVSLYFNGSGSDGAIIRKRVDAMITAGNDTLRESAMRSLGMDKGKLEFVLQPVRIDEQSTADARERIGNMLGGILPYILLIVCLMAAMYPAIDMGAGEKERGTLETLLLAPLPRSTLVGAKFLVLFTFGLTSAMLMVVSMGFLLDVFGSALSSDIAAVAAAITFPDLIMIASMMLPTAAIFAAILLTLSIYAKSYKEASGMLQPLTMLTLLPILLAMVPGVEMNWRWAAVPITNVSLAIKELIKGTMDYRMFSVILLSTTAIAGGLLLLCQWWFNRESVLFRD